MYKWNAAWASGRAAAVAAMLFAGSVAAQALTFTKDAPLRAEPKFDAAVVTQVKQNTQGEATGKQGPWLNIKVNNATGWALTADISFGTQAAATSSSGSSGFNLFSRSRTSTATSTVGIRGFDPETIKSAMGEGGGISDAQLKLLDSYAATKDAGQQHASSQSLAAVEIAK